MRFPNIHSYHSYLIIGVSIFCDAYFPTRFMKDCGFSLNLHHFCTPAQTWDWIMSGADWPFWIFNAVLVLAFVGVCVTPDKPNADPLTAPPPTPRSIDPPQ